ncbi:MAG TPA: PTS transporter subunit IIC, partial [Capillimicrobium sp.]
GAIVVASYWTLQPLWIEPLMRRVTGRDEWGYGHTSSLACLITGVASKPMARHSEATTEKLNMPRQLSFFKDVNVSTALIIGIVLLVAMAFADQEVVKEQALAFNEDIGTWTWGVIAALRFAAGIAIVLFGVRMFLGEIIPAFKGFSDKIVPGSRPALDVPTIFPFAPVGVMVGFVSGTVTFLVLMGVFAAFGWFTLVPPMIMLFFVCGGAAVFGNAVAGWRGAVLGGLISAIWLAVGQALLWGMLDNTAPELATLGDPDWYAISWLLLALAEPFGGSGGIWVVAAIIGVVTLVILGLLSARGVRVGAEPPARAKEAAS